MKCVIQLITLFALVFTVNTALAKKPKPPPVPEPVNLMNVVTVSAENGDYESLIEALNSITNAAEENQYVIQIGPGTYDLGNAQIILKPWVKINGAGRSFTVIKGSHASNFSDNDSAMVIGADHAALMRVGIENTGDGLLYSIGIRNDDASPAIKHVKVTVAGSVNNWEFQLIIHLQLVNVRTRFCEDVNDCDNYIGIWNVQQLITETTGSLNTGLFRSGTGVIVNNSSPFIVDSQLVGYPGLEIADSGSGAVNNMIIGGVPSGELFWQ